MGYTLYNYVCPDHLHNMAIEENKQKIIRTATELFMREGCKRVTMDYIATQMHISKRTLYESFATKEELLQACLEAVNAEICKSKHEAVKQSKEPLLLALFMMRNAAKMRHRYQRIFSDIGRYYPEINQNFFNFNTYEFHQSVLTALTEAQQKGLIRPSANVGQAVEAMSSFMQSQKPDEIDDKESWLNAMSEMGYTFLRGMLTPEAIALYDAQEAEFRNQLHTIDK